MTIDTVGTSAVADGDFVFLDIAPGSYTLVPALHAAEPTTVTIADTGAALTPPAVTTGMVRGTAWYDSNADGARQPDEAPVAGVPVTLDGVALALTDERGQFEFVGVETGSHRVTFAGTGALAPLSRMVNLQGDRGSAVGLPLSEGLDVMFADGFE